MCLWHRTPKCFISNCHHSFFPFAVQQNCPSYMNFHVNLIPTALFRMNSEQGCRDKKHVRFYVTSPLPIDTSLQAPLSSYPMLAISGMLHEACAMCELCCMCVFHEKNGFIWPKTRWEKHCFEGDDDDHAKLKCSDGSHRHFCLKCLKLN
jgi:hypothetical protein